MGTHTPQLPIVADSASAVEEAGYRYGAGRAQDRPDFVARQRVQPLDPIFVDYNLPLGDADRCLRPSMDRYISKPFHPATPLDGVNRYRSGAPHTDGRGAGYQHA